MPDLFTKKLFVGVAHDSSSFQQCGLDIAPSNGRWHKALHGIVLSGIQNNGQIQNVS